MKKDNLVEPETVEQPNMVCEVVSEEKPKRQPMTRRTKRLIFYAILVAFPMFQWVVMYVGVNLNSFKLAFQTYDINGGVSFAGFSNFVDAFNYLFKPDRVYLVTNSVTYILVSLVVKQTLTVLFSYYIYKKFYCSKLFKVILFMPSIISGLVYSWSFKMIMDDIIPKYITGPGNGLLSGYGGKYTFPLMVFFGMWLGFGMQMLIYSSGMSGIDESIVEAAEIDGATIMKEFWYITLPLMLNTIMIFIITGLTAFFTNQLSLYDFFGNSAGTAGTIGYRVFVDTLSADYVGTSTVISYSLLSALGMLESLFIIPVVLGLRALVNKYGPSTK